MTKIISPEESTKILKRQSMSTEQKLSELEERFEVMKQLTIGTFSYLHSELSNGNFDYDGQFKKIIGILQKEPIKQKADGTFQMPKAIEDMNPHVVKMWLIANNIQILRTL